MPITDSEILALFQNVGAITNSDCILLHTASGNTTKKITAELLRAYLNQDFAISINEQGYLVIGGETTDTKLVGMTLRVGATGLEVSSDGGTTYTELISFNAFRDKSVTFCTEAQYETWVANNQIDENKIYYVYEE